MEGSSDPPTNEKPDEWKREATERKSKRRDSKIKTNKDGSMSFGEESDKELSSSNSNLSLGAPPEQPSLPPSDSITLSKFKRTGSQEFYGKKAERQELAVQEEVTVQELAAQQNSGSKGTPKSNNTSLGKDSNRSSLKSSQIEEPEYCE